MLTTKSPRDTNFRFPNGSKISLLPHQQTLLYHCYNIIEVELKARFAMMNDPPGSGKTYVLLAMVCRDLFFPDGRRRVPVGLSKQKTIIVVPFNIHTQWMDAASRCFTSEGSSGSAVRIKSLTQYTDLSSLMFSPQIIRENDVLLTTSLYYASLSSAMRQQGYAVKRLVIDETDKVGALLGNTFVPCEHVWLMSASLSPSHGDEIVKKLCGKDAAATDIRHEVARCEDEFVAASFNLPEPEITYVVSHSSSLDMMNGVLSSGAMDALNACAYDDARLIEFSGISCARVVSSPKELMQVLLKGHTEAMHRLRDELNHAEYPELSENSPKHIKLREHESFVNKMTSRLRQHDICSICMEPVSNVVLVDEEGNAQRLEEENESGSENVQTAAVMGCCFNRFCLPCLEQWRHFKDSCPMCRTPLRSSAKGGDVCVVLDEKSKQRIRQQIRESIEEKRRQVEQKLIRQERLLQGFIQSMNIRKGGQVTIPRTHAQHIVEQQDGSISACSHGIYGIAHAKRSFHHDNDKAADVIDIVLQRLQDQDMHTPKTPKIIVFSDRTSLFVKVRIGLEEKKVTHSELDGGNVKDMDRIITRYKQGDLTVILANSSMFDCGMNLENTTDIVFVHKIKDHAKYQQIMGRAQRYGRKDRLMVWQLYHENELLEWMGVHEGNE